MDEVPHTLDAVRVGQHFANRLVDTARYSAHRPASSEQELADLIYSTAPVFSARFEVRAAPLTLALACLLVGCLCDGGSRGTWGGGHAALENGTQLTRPKHRPRRHTTLSPPPCSGWRPTTTTGESRAPPQARGASEVLLGGLWGFCSTAFAPCAVPAACLWYSHLVHHHIIITSSSHHHIVHHTSSHHHQQQPLHDVLL